MTQSVRPLGEEGKLNTLAFQWSRHHRWILVVVLVGSYLWWLIATSVDLGYARDEGFYFQAAEYYRQWFAQLLANPARALEQSFRDRYWRVNHEHPALIKSLFAAAKAWLSTAGFPDEGTAIRFPAMALASGAVGLTFVWARRVVGPIAAVVAALTLAFMPRVFYHSHLACFDMPMVCLWLATAYCYQRSLRPGAYAWIAATAVVYGFALNTKLNAWFLPVPLVAHWLLRSWLLRSGPGRWRLPWVLPVMLGVGFALWFATWPWLWHDSWNRLQAYVAFHRHHDYYNMEFLGTTYFRPPMPRAYAWVMTLATIPAVSILLAAMGLGSGGCNAWRRCQALVARRGQNSLAASEAQPLELCPSPSEPSADRLDVALLWVLCIGVAYGPWVFDTTPIFGGTKHWMTAYPFVALFAGLGFDEVLRRVRRGLASWAPWAIHGVGVLMAIAVLVGPWTMTRRSHPWGLSAYTPLVGGAPGAATLGLNRSFWGYTTGSLQAELNERASGGKVFVHDTAIQSYQQLQRDGRLDPNQRPWRSVAGSDLALYHHEQHMSRVEHMIWVDYGATQPVAVGAHDGVPVVWLYER